MINHQIKINTSFFDDLKKDYDKNFTDYVNSSVVNAIDLTNNKIQNKWELKFLNKFKYEWTTRTNIDGSISSTNGNIKMSNALHGHDIITIRLSSQSIAVRQFAIDLKPKLVKLSNLKTHKSYTRQGLPRAKILKQRSSIGIPTAFIATMKTGYTSIFRRDGKKIKEMRTITLPSMYEQKDFFGNLSICLDKI